MWINEGIYDVTHCIIYCKLTRLLLCTTVRFTKKLYGWSGQSKPLATKTIVIYILPNLPIHFVEESSETKLTLNYKIYRTDHSCWRFTNYNNKLTKLDKNIYHTKICSACCWTGKAKWISENSTEGYTQNTVACYPLRLSSQKWHSHW